MAFDSDTFFNELLSDAQISPEDKAQIEAAKAAIAKNPVVRENLGGHVLRQRDYSKQMAELQDKLGKVQTYRNELDTWKNEKEQELAEKAKQLSKASPPAGPTSKTENEIDMSRYLDRETFQKEKEAFEQGTLGIIMGMTKYTQDFNQRFGQALDVDALLQDVMTNGITLDEAYRRKIEPLEEKKRQDEIAAKIEQGVEEKLRERLANLHFPAGAVITDREPGVADRLNRTAGDNAPAVGAKAAVDAWVAQNTKGR